MALIAIPAPSPLESHLTQSLSLDEETSKGKIPRRNIDHGESVAVRRPGDSPRHGQQRLLGELPPLRTGTEGETL